MKRITQKECLEVLDKTPFPRNKNEHIFVMRFMLTLNDLTKSRGYRLFHWTDYCMEDEILVGSYIISNIEILSKEIIDKKIAEKTPKA